METGSRRSRCSTSGLALALFALPWSNATASAQPLRLGGDSAERFEAAASRLHDHEGREKLLANLYETRELRLVARCLAGCMTSLADLQDADGSWSCAETFGVSRFETTVWCLLALATTGNGWEGGDQRDVVRRGILWLHATQDDDGWFVDPDATTPRAVRSQALAVLACADSLLGTASDAPHAPLDRAVRALLGAEAVPRDGFGAIPAGAHAELLPTAWTVHALSAAAAAGVPFDREAHATIERCLGWRPSAPDLRVPSGEDLDALTRDTARLVLFTSAGRTPYDDVTIDPPRFPELPPRWTDATRRDALYFAGFAMSQNALAPPDRWSKQLDLRVPERLDTAAERTDPLSIAIAVLLIGGRGRQPRYPRNELSRRVPDFRGFRIHDRASLARMGGKRTAETIGRLLDRLLAQQAEDGSWDGKLEATAWSMRALMAEQLHPLEDGIEQTALRRAVVWLHARLGEDGTFRPDAGRETLVRIQALATHALIETAVPTDVPELLAGAQRALTRLESMAGDDGSWQGPLGEDPFLASLFATLACQSGHASGLDIHPARRAATLRWLRSLAGQDPQSVGATTDAEVAAAAFFGHWFAGRIPDEARQWGETLRRATSVWSPHAPLDRKLIQAVACHELGDETWREFCRILEESDAPIRAALDDLDVVQTARTALLLQSHYRLLAMGRTR